MIEDCVRNHRPNQVHIWVTRADGSVEDYGVVENLRTDDGLDWQAAVMGSGTQPAVAQYIGDTSDAVTPSASDSSLTSEITTGGLARAQGTYSHTSGAPSYKITHTFTASSSHSNVAKAGMFNASSSGTMVFETLFPSALSLNASDTLTIEWTVNI